MALTMPRDGEELQHNRHDAEDLMRLDTEDDDELENDPTDLPSPYDGQDDMLAAAPSPQRPGVVSDVPSTPGAIGRPQRPMAYGTPEDQAIQARRQAAAAEAAARRAAGGTPEDLGIQARRDEFAARQDPEWVRARAITEQRQKAAEEAKAAARATVPQRDFDAEILEQPWSTRNDQKPTRAQQAIEKAFRAQGRYDMRDMAQAVKDSQAQERGMPFAVEMHEAELAEINRVAQYAGVGLRGPQREIAIRQFYEFSVQEHMKNKTARLQKIGQAEEHKRQEKNKAEQDRIREAEIARRQMALKEQDHELKKQQYQDTVVAEHKRQEEVKGQAKGKKPLTVAEHESFNKDARRQVEKQFSDARTLATKRDNKGNALKNPEGFDQIDEAKIPEDLRTPEARAAKAQDMAEMGRMPHVQDDAVTQQFGAVVQQIGTTDTGALRLERATSEQLQALQDMLTNPNKVGMLTSKAKKMKAALDAFNKAARQRAAGGDHMNYRR